MEQRESPHGQLQVGAVVGQVRSSGRLCPSLTKVLGAAVLGAAWGSSLGFVPRAAASLSTSSGAWSGTGASVGSQGLGPSEARFAPLVRLFLLFDLVSWCSSTERGLG